MNNVGDYDPYGGALLSPEITITPRGNKRLAHWIHEYFRDKLRYTVDGEEVEDYRCVNYKMGCKGRLVKNNHGLFTTQEHTHFCEEINLQKWDPPPLPLHTELEERAEKTTARKRKRRRRRCMELQPSDDDRDCVVVGIESADEVEKCAENTITGKRKRRRRKCTEVELQPSGKSLDVGKCIESSDEVEECADKVRETKRKKRSRKRMEQELQSAREAREAQEYAEKCIEMYSDEVEEYAERLAKKKKRLARRRKLLVPEQPPLSPGVSWTPRGNKMLEHNGYDYVRDMKSRTKFSQTIEYFRCVWRACKGRLKTSGQSRILTQKHTSLTCEKKRMRKHGVLPEDTEENSPNRDPETGATKKRNIGPGRREPESAITVTNQRNIFEQARHLLSPFGELSVHSNSKNSKETQCHSLSVSEQAVAGSSRSVADSSGSVAGSSRSSGSVAGSSGSDAGSLRSVADSSRSVAVSSGSGACSSGSEEGSSRSVAGSSRSVAGSSGSGVGPSGSGAGSLKSVANSPGSPETCRASTVMTSAARHKDAAQVATDPLRSLAVNSRVTAMSSTVSSAVRNEESELGQAVAVSPQARSTGTVVSVIRPSQDKSRNVIVLQSREEEAGQTGPSRSPRSEPTATISCTCTSSRCPAVAYGGWRARQAETCPNVTAMVDEEPESNAEDDPTHNGEPEGHELQIKCEPLEQNVEQPCITSYLASRTPESRREQAAKQHEERAVSDNMQFCLYLARQLDQLTKINQIKTRKKIEDVIFEVTLQEAEANSQ